MNCFWTLEFRRIWWPYETLWYLLTCRPLTHLKLYYYSKNGKTISTKIWLFHLFSKIILFFSCKHTLDVTCKVTREKQDVLALFWCSNMDSPADGDSHCFWRAGTWTDHFRSQPTCLKDIKEGVAGGYRPCGNTHSQSNRHTNKQTEKINTKV